MVVWEGDAAWRFGFVSHWLLFRHRYTRPEVQKEVEESFDGGVCLQTSFELAVALAGPRGACRIFRVESTPLDGTTRRVDGVCAEVRGKINNDII